MTAPMSPELLPCPFCGESAGIRLIPPDVRFEESQIGYSVCCTNCGGESPERSVRSAAIAAWNRRASLAPAEADADYDAAWAEVREHTEQIKKDSERLMWLWQRGLSIGDVLADPITIDGLRAKLDAAMKEPGRD